MIKASSIFSLVITVLLIAALSWKRHHRWPDAKLPVFFIIFLTPWALSNNFAADRSGFMKHSWSPILAIAAMALVLVRMLVRS
jgi:uncharacterized membrane protein